MDALPKYSKDLSSDFLKLLESKGYTSWHVFNLRNSQAVFWKAIALGMILHTYRGYCRTMTHFNTQWREKVQELIDVDAKHLREQSSSQSQERFQRTAFWNEIGLKCVSMAVKCFTDNGKMDPANQIRSGRLMEFSNNAAFSIFAAHFDLFICLYEHQGDSRVVTHNYASHSPNGPMLCVNLAKEGDHLYYLYHNDIKGREIEDFPFMLHPGRRHPIVLDRLIIANAPQQSVDAQPRIMQSLADIIATQSAMILSVTPAIPPNCAELHSRLTAQMSSLQALLTTSRSSLSVDISSIQSILNLPVTQPREPHTITTCQLYADVDADLLQYHSHSFHRTCLQSYLERLALVPPQLPMCPISGCGQCFPDDVLDLSPTISISYVTYRRGISLQGQSGPASHASYQTLPASRSDCWVCVGCSRVLDRSWFLVHGCRICYYCAAGGANWTCPLCYAPLREDEISGVVYTRNQYSLQS
jgi:hypothetical protein